MAKAATPHSRKYVRAIGRRKTATAVVKLVRGKLAEEPFLVNGKPLEQYWPSDAARALYLEPFRVTNMANQYTGTAVVSGSGKQSQLDAFVLGVSRAIEKIDKEKFRPILKKKGFLTRDARERERRKAGLAQKARAKKQSPKR